MIWAVLLGVIGLFYYEKTSGGMLPLSNPKVTLVGGYPDIDSTDQGGNYDRTYDAYYESASGVGNVPFALIKAHAIRESKQDPNATHYDNEERGGSIGIMQTEFKFGKNYWSRFGYDDSSLGTDGAKLFDPTVNTILAAQLIRENLDRFGNLRDAINAYNTGQSEKKIPAPNNYVNDVIKYYSILVGQKVG